MKTLFVRENPRLIVFKMRLNRNSVPEGMPFCRPEITNTPRGKQVQGKQIASGRTCDVGPLVNGLTRTHVLVDAFYTNMESGYVCAHFVFSLEKYAQVALRIVSARLKLHNDLRRLLSQGVWVTDVYVNPFVRLGRVVPSFHSVSVNCRNFSPSGAKAVDCLLEFGAPQPALPARSELAAAD